MSAYQLNKFLYQLHSAEKVREALSDQRGVLQGYRLSPEEVQALEAEDLAELYRLGANPYMIRNVYRTKFRY